MNVVLKNNETSKIIKSITSFFASSGVHYFLNGLAVVILLLLARFPCHFDEVIGVRFEVVLVLFIAATRQEDVMKTRWVHVMSKCYRTF